MYNAERFVHVHCRCFQCFLHSGEHKAQPAWINVKVRQCHARCKAYLLGFTCVGQGAVRHEQVGWAVARQLLFGADPGEVD